MGILYYGIGGRVPEEIISEEMTEYLYDFAAFIFMQVFFNFAMNTFDTVLSCTYVIIYSFRIKIDSFKIKFSQTLFLILVLLG